MSVVRLTSKKTLPILLQALRRIQFTQTELAKITNTSIGRVNKIISWLKEKDIILKETGRYVVSKPNLLADLIANQQVIKKTRTYNVLLSKEALKKIQKEKDIIFCLENAFDQENATINIIDSQKAQSFFDTLPRGEQLIVFHEYDTIIEYMDDVRKIIDLKSVGERIAAESLAQQTWRTRQ